MKHAVLLTGMLVVAGVVAWAGVTPVGGVVTGMKPVLPSVYQPGTTLRCIAADVSLRERPAITARRSGSLRRGEAVRLLVVGTTEDMVTIATNPRDPLAVSAPWYRVQTSTGRTGWVFGAFLHQRWFPFPPRVFMRGVYPIGWSRNGHLAFLCGIGGDGVRLYVYEARSGRCCLEQRFWDRTRYPGGQLFIDWLWDTRKTQIHTVLNIWGIESGGRAGVYSLEYRVKRRGVAFELHHNGKTPFLEKTAPAGRRRLHEFHPIDFAVMKASIGFPAVITSPYGPEVALFLGLVGMDSPVCLFNTFVWTAGDRKAAHAGGRAAGRTNQ